MELASFIRAPVLYHQALKDEWVNDADVDAFEAVLVKQRTPFQRFRYDALHGFFAYNRDPTFNPAAAALAWERTVPFLRAHAGARIRERPLAARRVEVAIGDGELKIPVPGQLLHHTG